jgi:hypothetical protein
MISSTTQKWFVSALAIASVAVASLVSAPKAGAQPQCEVPCPDVGQIKCCPGQSISVLQSNGGQINFTALTNGCFMINSCTPPVGCQWSVNMSIQNFTGTGTDPNTGLTYNWSNDPTKISTGSQITALSAASQFPADGFIQFWVTASVAGTPGTYRSTTEVRIDDHQIMSWDPFRNEAFRMAPGTQVQLVNDVTGDVITLTDLTSILN